MYSYQEAFEKCLQYFGGDELAANVVISKYLLRDNENNLLECSPEDMHRRIAKEFARIEATKFKKPYSEEEIYSLLDRFRYIIPQGSPMFGIGNNHQYVSLGNCFLLDLPLDSYSSILEIDEQIVQISKRRGGIGVDISNLRPDGASVTNSSRTSTGIIPFMMRYSNTLRETGQGNRRAAGLISIDVHHPQVVDFAVVKRDKSKVTGANISIRLSQEFIDAVLKDDVYEQRFPVDYKEKGIKPTVSKMVKAREVWNEIIHSAFLASEPGLLLWHNVQKFTPTECYQEYKSKGTNPCLPGWARLLTKDGIRKLSEVNIGDQIWSKEGWTKVTNKWSTGLKQVHRFSGTRSIFYGTEDHRIVSKGEKVTASKAFVLDSLVGCERVPTKLEPQDIMDGLVLGDGSVHKASNDLVFLYIGVNDFDYHTSEIGPLITRERPGLISSGTAWEISTSISASELPETFNREIPCRFVEGSPERVCGFLRGLFSANGSVCHGRVTLKASSFKVIEDVQVMLSSVGVRSYYTTNRSTVVAFKNGEYKCKQSYDLNITRDRKLFLEKIGFIQKYKNEKLLKAISEFNRCDKPYCNYSEIKSNTFLSVEEVFDLTVDNKSHTFWCNGSNISNCGELVLSPKDSCRLMCLNLFSYVDNKFTNKASFNFEKFDSHAYICQRLMDDLVDLEAEKIRKIIQKVESDPEPINTKCREINLWKEILRFNVEGRRSGTGLTALGDCLAALGIKYGSEQSIKMAERIYRALKLACYRASVDMAEELGPFKVWDYEKEKNHPFLLRIAKDDPELWKRMSKVGRRNIALLTQAPTGTLSTLSQTSSGIEPVFQLSYTRRKKISPHETNVRVDFVDQSGDRWQEFEVLHPKLKDWMEVTGEKDIKKSPWFGCCAEDLDWVKRVDMTAAIQKQICHSISQTINVPEDVKESEIAEIYLAAAKSGCKGITVYRKNSRSGVLIDNKPKLQKTKPPKRPESLTGEIHHFVLKKQRYYAAVGSFEGEAYEIFVGVNHDENGEIVIPKSVSKGSIVKRGRSKYLFITNEGQEFHLTNGTSDENADALARMTSTALRHGTPIEHVVHQLEKITGSMNSFAKILARALKSFVPDKAQVAGEECPDCKGKLIRSNGCKSCSSCGWTACS